MDEMFPGNDSGSKSEACSVSNNLHHDEVWYFSREKIEKNSPSRRDGIDLKKETFLRESYCTFLKDLGEKLTIPQITIATAIVLCHRFFIHQSHAKNDSMTIATVCMLLAGKVEETPRDFKDIVIFSHEIIHNKKLDADQRKDVYEQQKELVKSGEELVLSTLNFDLIVRHPYQSLVKAIKKHKVKVADTDFLEVAQRIVNNCLETSLCLQYKPHHIAGYVCFHAAEHLAMDLQGHREVLYREFDITLSQLEDIHGQMLGLDAWYFSREEIETNSPSNLDGIDLKKEAHLRKLYCKFLIDLSARLNVNQTTIATAIVLCHRFFIRQSHAKNDSLTIATVCMLLAGKVEDSQRDLKDIVIFSHEIRHDMKLDADQRKEVYEKQKELVKSGEELVLSTLNFDLTVRHPHNLLAHAIEKYKVQEAKARFSEVAQIIVNDCLQKALSLQYKPHHIAGYSFFVAAKMFKMDLKAYGGKGWFQEFDITPDQLEDINAQILELIKNDSDESVTPNPDDYPVLDRSSLKELESEVRQSQEHHTLEGI